MKPQQNFETAFDSQTI